MAGTILYATSLVCAAHAPTRIPWQRQSAAARALQDSLSGGIAPAVSSRSHSRVAVAAAVGDAQVSALGIDIEFMDQGRPFAALAGYFTEDVPADLDAVVFYRLWAFAEAHFKAFQLLPTNNAFRAVGKLSDNETLTLDDGTTVLQHRVSEQFLLCLVGRAMQDECDVRCIRQ
jgi:hypothetical protein